MWGWSLAAAGLVIAGCSSSSSEDANGGSDVALPIEVKTAEGSVRGEANAEIGARVFRGIPYAAPPTGANRWQKPQAVTPWTDVRDATKFGHRCPQPNLDGTPNTDDADEDCLFLNVYTPAKKSGASNEAMPVMVWIHGGAFTNGSAVDDVYEASKLAVATGAIVVTINYRLGVLGFLAHPSLGANFGLYDQRAALEWVQRNAGAFGGDPSRVTIFGESAGGQSVSALTLSSETANKGLFHRAIVQSGAISRFPIPGFEQSVGEASDLAKAVGCAEADFACLRSKPANELITALKYQAGNQPRGGLFQGSVASKPWVPVADGVFVTQHPADAFASGTAAKVPYLIGTTKNEGGLFHAGLLGDVKLTAADDYTAVLARNFGDKAAAIAEHYPPSAFGGDANKALERVDTLAFFVCPSRFMARAARDAGNATFLYQISRTPNGGLTNGLGPVHSVDLVFLFDSDLGRTGRAGDDARDLVAAMQGYWGSFAKSGAPSAEGAPAWPAFANGAEKYVVLDVPIAVAEDLEKADCDFWDTIDDAHFPLLYDPPQ